MTIVRMGLSSLPNALSVGPKTEKVPRMMKNSSRKHHSTTLTPDFHLTYSKNGGNRVRIKMIKIDNFQYFSIKSYVVDVC